MRPEIKILQTKYNWTSKVYDLLDFPFEYLRYRELRKIVWGFAKGKILDAGVGTGRNIEFYPKGGEVIGIDLSIGMLEKARNRMMKNNICVDLLQMDLLNTSFPDNHFDTVIATFVFCVLPDSVQIPALREIRRICKKDGEIILLEYAYSKKLIRRLWMNILSPYVKWLYGAGFDRHTSEYIRQENFEILEERFIVDDVIKLVRIRN